MKKMCVNDSISKKVCELWGVTMEDMVSDQRFMPLPYARAMFGFYTTNIGRLTTTQAGKLINRNHSTISTYRLKYNDLLKYNKEFRNKDSVMAKMFIQTPQNETDNGIQEME